MLNFIKNKLLINKFKIFLILLFISILIVISFCISFFYFKPTQIKDDSKDTLYYKVSFEDIAFLEKDIDLINFIKPFKESCNIFYKKDSSIVTMNNPYVVTIKDWQNICNLFNRTKFTNNEDIISFIKENFNTYMIKGEKKAKITGYYRIELEGSLTKNDKFKYPLYKTPSDLITVNLSDFSKDLKNKKIFGRISNNNLIPYYSRKEINKGLLENKNLELVWLNNKYSVFLLHVQGSGIVKLKDHNKVMYLSYDGRNGHPFKGIYNYMKEKGYVKSNNLKGLDYFYDFFDKNPDKIDEVLNNNPSYIFFKEVNKSSWYAAFGTNPYSERTVAVDPNYIGLGTPLLIKMKHPDKKNIDKEIIRLVIANDVGSAIKGAGRIDFYWGVGDTAGYNASITNQKGSLYLFLPKNLDN